MSEAVIAALITAIAAVVSQMLISRANSKDLYAKLDKNSELADEKIKAEIAVVKTEITTLSQRVHAHNNLIERMYAAESDIRNITEKQKVANHRIDDLEKKG